MDDIPVCLILNTAMNNGEEGNQESLSGIRDFNKEPFHVRQLFNGGGSDSDSFATASAVCPQEQLFEQ